MSFALAWAETLGASDIFIGVNAVDYSGYPDCRPEYLAAYEAMANIATKAGVEGLQHLAVHAPLAHWTKAQIIERGLALGVDYSLTHSCYEPGEGDRPCGTCASCLLRAKGFAEVGAPDPAAPALSLRPALPASRDLRPWSQTSGPGLRPQACHTFTGPPTATVTALPVPSGERPVSRALSSERLPAVPVISIVTSMSWP